MREVLPSQVVQVIDQFFPWAMNDPLQASVQPQDGPNLRGVLDLVEAIPDSLLSCPPVRYAAFIHARAIIKDTLDTWKARGGIGGLPYVRDGKSPVSVLRAVLAMCPDENPPAEHAELLFVSDAGLRDTIRLDVGAAHRALANAEWKAATVLAGSAIEALLHWRLSQLSDAERASAIAIARSRGLSSKPDSASLDRWILNEYVYVARELNLIKEQTAAATFLAKDYRNLIHPGAAIRVGAHCDRASSHVAVGAMEGVITDLTPP